MLSGSTLLRHLAQFYCAIYMRGYSDIYRFLAVKSTGNITDESSAKFCGVVIGKMDYANSAGGVAHAIQLVGMFDLPENTGKPATKK